MLNFTEKEILQKIQGMRAVPILINEAELGDINGKWNTILSDPLMLQQAPAWTWLSFLQKPTGKVWGLAVSGTYTLFWIQLHGFGFGEFSCEDVARLCHFATRLKNISRYYSIY